MTQLLWKPPAGWLRRKSGDRGRPAARTPQGLALMIELAETLQAAVVDMYGRMNFPWRHPLNQTRATGAQNIAAADVILGLELTDFWGVHEWQTRARGKRISIHSGRPVFEGQLPRTSNASTPVISAIAADAEATLPYLHRSDPQARGRRPADRYSRAGARNWQRITRARSSNRALTRPWDGIIQPITDGQDVHAPSSRADS